MLNWHAASRCAALRTRLLALRERRVEVVAVQPPPRGHVLQPQPLAVLDGRALRARLALQPRRAGERGGGEQ